MSEKIRNHNGNVAEVQNSDFEAAMKDLPSFEDFQTRRQDNSKDNTESVVLQPKSWDPEESNRQFKERTERDIALYDKYDLDNISEESFNELLGGESTPSPTLDSASLIENVIWVNQKKLQRTGLSEEDRKAIEQKISEAETAKDLHERGVEYRKQLEQELEYYNLPADERTNDRWRQAHGLMSERDMQKACFEEPTIESATEFAKSVLERVDVQTIDKIIAVKQTGDKRALVEEIARRLAFLTQFDNQVPLIEYADDADNNDDACHNYLGYGVDKITLSKKLLTGAYDLDYVVMTTAHEMMHAHQSTIMRNADDTDKKAQEYKYNLDNYISANSQDYNEYLKYHNQLVEIEAFCFGEQFRDLVSSREQYLYERDHSKGILDKIKQFIGRRKK